MVFKKGDPRPPGSGRKKGVINGLTARVKADIEAEYRRRGGRRFLAALEVADFLDLLKKMLPREVKADVEVRRGVAEILSDSWTGVPPPPTPAEREAAASKAVAVSSGLEEAPEPERRSTVPPAVARVTGQSGAAESNGKAARPASTGAAARLKALRELTGGE